MLELTKIAVLHKFHSRDWVTYLARKLPLSKSLSDAMNLKSGEALVYAANHGLRVGSQGDDPDSDVLKIRIRPRLTMDGGNSRIHRGKPGPDALPVVEHIEGEEEEEKSRQCDSSGNEDSQGENDEDSDML